ncbi:hypothetical protein KWY15_17110 [Clostridioides difficile]|uniref:Uncharacterized protein n=4 Tax=Leicestervirus TaxID=2843416 RepID=A0A1J1J9P6_9CAUD|nr:hypothetical protein [Clostridioides difficile]YP_004508397.1 hypothetical protein phiCD38-2_gp19 [Clostridium phage phiCD38-2]YP_009214147.1 hypothetical protein PHICD146_20019 [Clostridium phage phiCD146]ALY06963.1 hypothetical protein CDHS1_20 [Clostridium phage CDSH1]WFG79325.1 hypothetical protein JPGLOODI_00008 [Clostridioides phage AR1075-1]CUL03805.1 hypothetical protein [Clostridium phage slur17]AEF56894.1 hypothetical protein phiCD38-2_gp19 [Clostridium phage phiCD38-2]EGT365653
MVTIFYSKRTGEIYNCIKSEMEQDYTCFADREEDYRQILDKIVVEDIPEILNPRDYKIENGKFVLKEKEIIKEFTPKMVE